MPWISEINFRGNNNSGNEYVEITLAPGEDPADYTLSAYDQNGFLHAPAGLTGGEITLDTVTGVPHPDDPSFTVYTVYVGIKNADADSNEATGVALTDNSTGTVLDFFSAAQRAPITALEGAASGTTSTNNLEHTEVPVGDSYQYTPDGTRTVGTPDAGTSVLCIAAGMRIKTARGPVAAGALKVGDLVWTLDRGMQPLRWIGTSLLDPVRHGAPVRITPAAFGGLSSPDGVVLSGQHRVLLQSPICTRMFGTDVLVAAKKLVGFPGVEAVPGTDPLEVVHLLFDRHEVIAAEGLLCESLLLAPESEKVLRLPGQPAHHAPARPIATRQRLRTLLARHAKNAKPLFPAITPARLPASALGL